MSRVPFRFATIERYKEFLADYGGSGSFSTNINLNQNYYVGFPEQDDETSVFIRLKYAREAEQAVPFIAEEQRKKARDAERHAAIMAKVNEARALRQVGAA